MKRALVVLLAALAVVLLSAAPAQALPNPFGDCKNPPTPAMPGDGWTSWLAPKPSTPPPAADPWAPHPTTSIYEQYGLGGWEFHTYDQGCVRGPDDASRSMGNTIANLFMVPAMLGLGLLAGLAHVAFHPDQWLSILDKPLAVIVAALKSAVWTPIGPLFILALGVIVVWHSRRWQWAKAGAVVVFALVVILAAAVVFTRPVEIAHVADRAESQTVTQLASAVGGVQGDTARPADVAMTGAAVDALLWPRWLARNFGDPNSPTAKRYGPELFDAGAMTWSEAEQYRADPNGEGKRIVEAKQAQWKRVAAAVQESDPVAYGYLKGEHPVDAIGDATAASLSVMLTLVFLLAALVLVIASYLVIRLAVMLFAALAAVALLPWTQHLAKAPLMLVAYALLNSAIFTMGALVSMRVFQALLDPASGLPGFFAVVLMALFGGTMWVCLRPFRRLTRMVGRGYNPSGEFTGAWDRTKGRASSMVGHGVDLGKAAAAAYVGGAAAGAAVADRLVEQQPAEQSSTTAEWTQPQDHLEVRPALDRSPGTVWAPEEYDDTEIPEAESYVDDGAEVFVVYNPATDRVEAEQ